MNTSGALIVIAVVAVLAYMYFFNDLKYHSAIQGHTEASIMQKAGADDESSSANTANSGNTDQSSSSSSSSGQ
jgi:hypothetical protein